MLAVETRGLTKTYGGRAVVSNFDMHVKAGEVYGFVGKNGAGKSTVMKLICDLIAPTAGEVVLFGRANKDGRDGGPRPIQRVGALIESPGLLPNLSAFDNLMVRAQAIGIADAKERSREVLSWVGLADVDKKRTKKFSLGMKQRLGIGLALLGSPDLLLLDEPFNGLDPEGTRELRQLIARMNEVFGVTVVISSHVLDQLDRIATCYGVIADGRMVRELSAAEVEAECGESLLLRADQPQRAFAYLEQQFPAVSFFMEPGDRIRVRGGADGRAIALALHGQDIAVLELSETKRDIEDYFVELMEGGRHV